MAKSRSHNDSNGEAFESMGTNFINPYTEEKQKESFTKIYESMLLNPVFQSLNLRQRFLYVVCKAQYYGKRKPERDFKDVEEYQGKELFYLNWGTVQRYGIYKPTMHSGFYKDMKALIDAGLIERVTSGKNQRTKSVYRYSSKWRTLEQ